jgi:protein tyrosine phosphatase type 4A
MTDTQSVKVETKADSKVDVEFTGKLLNKPSYFKHMHMRFMVMDAPLDSNVMDYIEVCKKRKVSLVVRACQPMYSTSPFLKEGINVVELPFQDGDPPPRDIIEKWLGQVRIECNEQSNDLEEKCIAVHCVAGLGRAPALVAIALIESGMKNLDAISFIRKKRRGAFNARQLQYLENYKTLSASSPNKCCSIM